MLLCVGEFGEGGMAGHRLSRTWNLYQDGAAVNPNSIPTQAEEWHKDCDEVYWGIDTRPPEKEFEHKDLEDGQD